MKTRHLFLPAALLLMFSACREENNPTTPQFYELSNASVSQVIHVGQSDFVAVGSQFDQNNQSTAYVARYNLQNGVVWEQNLPHSAGMITGHRIAYYGNDLFVLANDGTGDAVVHRCDLATGASQSNITIDNVEGNDIKADLDGALYLTGSTTDVNVNKPDFDATTDLSDIWAARYDGSNLSQTWESVYGFSHLDRGEEIGFADNNLRVAGTTQVLNSSGGVEHKMLAIKYSKVFPGVMSQQYYGTGDVQLAAADLIGDEIVALYFNVSNLLSAQTLDAANNNLTEIANVDLSALLPAGRATSVHQYNGGYIVVSNSGSEAYVTGFDGNWARTWQTALDGAAIGSQSASIGITAGKAAVTAVNGADYCVVPLNLLSNNITTAAFVLVNASTGAVVRL